MELTGYRVVGEFARLRQGSYRLLGAAFLFPEETTVAMASQAAVHLRQRRRWASQWSFFGPWDRFLQMLAALTSAEVPELQQMHARLTTGTAAGERVPVTESEYSPQPALESGIVMGTLEKEYASAGLSSSSLTGETSDHIAVEMEFMSHLCGLEAQTWAARNPSDALETMEREKRFLDKHPCRWVPVLARQIASVPDSGVYAAAAQAAWAMVVHDSDFLETLIQQTQTETHLLEGATP